MIHLFNETLVAFQTTQAKIISDYIKLLHQHPNISWYRCIIDLELSFEPMASDLQITYWTANIALQIACYAIVMEEMLHIELIHKISGCQGEESFTLRPRLIR